MARSWWGRDSRVVLQGLLADGIDGVSPVPLCAVEIVVP